MIKVWTDGATDRIAVVFDKETLKETTGIEDLQYTWILKTNEKVTNNAGEYLAIKFALEKCLEYGLKEVLVLSDSQLCIRQLQGVYAIRQPHLLELWQQVKELEAKVGKVEYRWMPREFNKAGRLLG